MNINRRSKKFNYLITAMILLAAFCFQPDGIHLKLCFGEDGHFDISTVACQSNQQLPVENHPKSSPDDHHEKCNDFTPDCNDEESCELNSILILSNSTIKDVQIAPISIVSNVLPQPSDNESPLGFISERCDYHPPFLSSVVLLI